MPDATEQATVEREEGESARPFLWTVAFLLLSGLLLLAHLEVGALGPAYTGLLLVADHLFDVLLTLLAAALVVAAGERGLRALRLRPESAPDVLLHSAAAGVGVWGTAFLVLGFTGLLTPVPLAVSIAVGAGLVAGELRGLPSLVVEVADEVRAAVGSSRLLAFGVLVSVLVSLFLMIHGWAPPGDWDSLMYHLEVPDRWLAEGRVHVPDGNLHVAYTGLFQILYVPLLALGSATAPALLNGVFAVLLGLATFQVGNRLFDGETGLFAAVVLWASTGLLIVATTARVDTTVAFFLLLAQGSVALALVGEEGGTKHLLRAALVLGLAAGIKYHGLAFAAAIAPVGLWAVWKEGADLKKRTTVLGLGAVLFVAGVAPWVVKNVVLLGEPFYPFFTNQVLPSWLADLYGSRAIPPEVDPRAFGSLNQAREPFDLLTLFLSPERLTVEAEGVHYNLNPLLLALPLWIAHWRSRRVLAMAGPALLYGIGVAVTLSAINLRYLFPALPGLTIVTTFFVVSAARRMLGPVARTIVVAGIAVLTLIPTARSVHAWTVRAPVLGHSLGTVSSQEYLARGFAYYAALVGAVNEAVPRDGRVLLLWEARGFYFAPDIIPDNVLTNWPFLRPYVERTGGCLTETGITHVMAATGAAGYYQQRGADPEVLGVREFGAFARRCLEPVDVRPAFGLYRVRSGGVQD